MFYGLDVHKELIQVCQISSEGRKVREFSIQAKPESIEAFARTLSKKDQLVLEATFHTWAIHAILSQSKAGRVVVANPNQVKAIAAARIKTDKIDAHTLAQLLRADFIPEVQMPDELTWQLRQLIHHRRFLTKQKTAYKNVIRGVLNKKLIDCPFRDLCGRGATQWLESQLQSGTFNPAEAVILQNAQGLLNEVVSKIEAIDEKLLQSASVSDEAKILMTIPGVSLGTAMGFLSAIGDVHRFDSPEKLASYFGLVPSVSQSGSHCYRGGITKAGRSAARWLAIESAQTLSQSDSPLAATYHRIKRKKGHNVAVTAMARKLVVLAWHMLKNREPYRYAPVNRTRRKLRGVSPGVGRARQGEAPQTLDGVYARYGLPSLQEPTAGEKRTATLNKRQVTAAKKKDPYIQMLKKARSKPAPSSEA